jgi:molecular chaperone GrpE
MAEHKHRHADPKADPKAGQAHGPESPKPEPPKHDHQKHDHQKHGQHRHAHEPGKPGADPKAAATAGAPEGAGFPPEEGDGAPPSSGDLSALIATIASLNAEVTSLKDQLLRALAETENVRRRTARERDETAKYAITGFAREMASVADNLNRALEAVPVEAIAADPTLKAFADGVVLTEKELLAALDRHGVKRIDPLGERFDHNLHQAMFELPGTGQPAGTIVQVMQPGYTIHDRLLRPALVGLAKGDPDAGS